MNKILCSFVIVLLLVLTSCIFKKPKEGIPTDEIGISLPEHPRKGLELASARPSRYHSDTSGLTYEIAEQNPSGAFTVNASTGIIRVGDSTLFDYETRNLILVIRVLKDNKLQAKVILDVNIDPNLTDVDENSAITYTGNIRSILINNCTAAPCHDSDAPAGWS